MTPDSGGSVPGVEEDELEGTMLEHLSAKDIALTVAIAAMWPFLAAAQRVGEWIQEHRR
jgi:hypothetical protein